MTVHGTTLGKKIQLLRQARGLTQQELATQAPVSLSTVSKLEEGAVTRPSAKVLLKLVNVLKFDLDSLLSPDPLPEHLRPLKAAAPSAEHPPIRFVYFDVGGVLAHTESLLLQRVSAGINRPIDAVRTIYHRYAPLSWRGKLSLEDLQFLIMFKLNVRYHGNGRANLFRNWTEYMRPNQAVHDFAKQVAKSYPIGLLTNIFGDGFYDDMLGRGLIPDLPYQTVVQSADVGYIKPESQIYEQAAVQAGVPAASILLIDDRQVNVLGARRVGWQAEWFNETKTESSISRIKRKFF